MRRALTLAGLVVGAALLLATAGSPRGIKEGGTFRVGIQIGGFGPIDPALPILAGQAPLLSPACGSLMSYPDKRPPAGFRIAPELAEADPVVSRDGRTYTFTIRKDARFSSGAAVTARDVVHSLERILTPVMQSDQVDLFLDIVGAWKMLDGKATRLAGAVAKGRTLIVRLKKPIVDLPARMGFCVVPAALPADPEGAKAPLPSPAPYYVAKYVANQSLVLERNRFYRGPRPHHVDRIVADLSSDPNAIVDAIASGNLDWGWAPSPLFQRGTELAQRYGLNKSQFFVAPGSFVRMFVLNVSRPLFKNNPKLRQAVNFAVNRKALTRELGAFSGTPTDQYLRISDERIYPLAGPDLRTARKLAKGRTRGGKAVLYTRSDPPEVAQAQVLQQNLKAIGLEVEITSFPSSALLFEKLATRGEPFDIGRIGWGTFEGPTDPSLLNDIFHGGRIGQPDNRNWSYFNSPRYNRLLNQAARLSGPERYRVYGELDVQISQDAAPAIPFAFLNNITFVSARVGCVILNPLLDLTAVCLK